MQDKGKTFCTLARLFLKLCFAHLICQLPMIGRSEIIFLSPDVFAHWYFVCWQLVWRGPRQWTLAGALAFVGPHTCKFSSHTDRELFGHKRYEVSGKALLPPSGNIAAAGDAGTNTRCVHVVM